MTDFAGPKGPHPDTDELRIEIERSRVPIWQREAGCSANVVWLCAGERGRGGKRCAGLKMGSGDEHG